MQAEYLGEISLDQDDSVNAARVRMQALLRESSLPAIKVDFLAVGFGTWCQEMRLRGAKSLFLSFLNRSSGASLLVDAKLNAEAFPTPYRGSPFFEHFQQADGSLRIFVVLSDRAAPMDLAHQLRQQLAYKTREQLFAELEQHKLHLEDEVATQTAALRSSEAQVRAMLEGSPVAVRVAALDGRVLFVNSSFASLYQLSREKMLAEVVLTGSELTAQVQANESPDIQDALRQGHDVLNCPVTLRSPTGTLVHVVASYMNVTYNNTPAVLTWMFDVTDLHRAKEMADEATRVRTDFLSNMSHEIRTPLNAIIGMSHLTLQTALNSQQQTYVGKIYKAGKSLLSIVTDILDFSKVENGQITLAASTFKLDELLAELQDEYAAKAHDKGLSYSQHLLPDVPLDLTGDAPRLQQVLTNLVGNAIKFTAQGSVTVELSSPQREEGRVQLQCRVTDTGVGMSAEARQKLFQPFSQGDSSTTRQFGGTGLGLVICQQLLVLMDGGIWVDSEPGKGSSFVMDAWFGVAPGARLQPHLLVNSQVQTQAESKPEPVPPLADVNGGQSNWSPPRAALVRMRALLDDSDADALDLVADIPTAGAPPLIQTQLLTLERQVSEFNFKAALAALDEIERLIA